MSKYKLNRKCPVCNFLLLDKNKTGFCTKHRDRTGTNNPFFGKTHTKETVSKLKELCALASTEKWKNEIYREKVIKAVSKPRRERFKQEQSVRIKEWYLKNPEQRTIRSISMKENWKNGKIATSPHISLNRSKIELEFFQALQAEYPDISREVIKTKEGWFFPDCISLRDRVIIELFGDYWHGNPEKYAPEDKVAHNSLAKDVWEHDGNRIASLENLGYQVIIIWESEYKKDKASIINELSAYLNWDACSF